jgi:hypothetical protein
LENRPLAETTLSKIWYTYQYFIVILQSMQKRLSDSNCAEFKILHHQSATVIGSEVHLHVPMMWNWTK